MNSSKKALLHLLAVSFLSASGAELYEDFHDAPNLSEGWTYGTLSNVKTDSYSGATSQYVDNKTAAAGERTSLKIERPGKLSEGILPLLEIVSTQMLENVRQYSFYYKRTTGDTSADRISVYGRCNETAEWILLGGPTDFATKGQWLTNSVPDNLGIRQVKFSFSSEPSTTTFQNCAIDSLRVRTGEALPPSEDEPSAPSDQPEPTKPTKLKLEATAPDQIQATWEGVPGENGYRVELFRSEDRRETDTPDFSGLASAVWPEGWTHSDDIGFGLYSNKLIKVLFSSCWFASPFYPKPITRFEYKFKSNKTSPEVGQTKLVIWASKTETDDDWIEFDRLQVTGSMSNVVSIIDAAEDVRRLRFSVDYQGSDTSYAREMLLGVNVLSIVCGERLTVPVAAVETSETATVFSNLDATASYFVTVAPTPSADQQLVATSDALDLSKEHFRKTGAVPVTLGNLTYEERFDSLSNFVSQTKTAKIALDYWQFVKDGAELPSLVLTQTNTAPQNAGCYVCRDKEKISDIDSAMIGTLASKDSECAVGLGLKNETDRILKNPTVTFDSVQRSSNANSATFAFEWRISDGETSIAAGSDWEEVSIPQTAPVTSEGRSVMPEYRLCDIVVAIPAKVPAGKVLLLRWRHPKTTSGPMMAIDNVRISFDKPGGFCLFIR